MPFPALAAAAPAIGGALGGIGSAIGGIFGGGGGNSKKQLYYQKPIQQFLIGQFMNDIQAMGSNLPYEFSQRVKTKSMQPKHLPGWFGEDFLKPGSSSGQYSTFGTGGGNLGGYTGGYGGPLKMYG